MNRARRGTAVVETSILMLVLLPLVFYTIFLQDLLRYKLEQQEAIITPAWDFAVVAYSDGKRDDSFDRDLGAKSVQRINRQKVMDHSTIYDGYTMQDGSDKKHHSALAAHQCWVTQGASQVTCSLDAENGKGTVFSVGSAAWYLLYGNRGGFSNCTARLGVFNKFVPQHIFTKMGGKGGLAEGENAPKMMKQKQFKDSGGLLGSLHGEVDVDADDSKGDATEDEQFFFNPKSDPDRHMMLQDSWALTRIEDVNPKMGGYKVLKDPLLKRILPYYILYGSSVYADSFTKAGDFSDKLSDDGWIDDTGISANIPGLGTLSLHSATMDGTGDMMQTPPAHYENGDHVDGSGGSEQMQKDMMNNRSKSYFGG